MVETQTPPHTHTPMILEAGRQVMKKVFFPAFSEPSTAVDPSKPWGSVPGIWR